MCNKLTLRIESPEILDKDKKFLLLLDTFCPLSSGKWNKLYAILAEIRKQTKLNYCLFETSKYIFDTTNWTIRNL